MHLAQKYISELTPTCSALPILTALRGSLVRGPRVLRTESSVVRVSRPLSSTVFVGWVDTWGRMLSSQQAQLTAHYILQNTHYTLHTAHWTLHNTHCTLHTTHYTVHTAHYIVHTTRYTDSSLVRTSSSGSALVSNSVLGPEHLKQTSRRRKFWTPHLAQILASRIRGRDRRRSRRNRGSRRSNRRNKRGGSRSWRTCSEGQWYQWEFFQFEL